MESFFYEGTDTGGNRQQGRVEAAGYLEAVEKIKLQGLLPIKLWRQGLWGRLKERLRARSSSGKEAFVIAFCKEMSLMLEAGLPIDQATAIAAKGGGKGYGKIGIRLADNLKRGYALSESMKLAEGVFSPLVIAIARAGERSGNLPEALGRLHKILATSHAAREKLKGAMAYPAFLCLVSLSMLMLLVYQVLPVFATVFASMGAKVPWTTELLLGMGEHLELVLLYLCGGALGVFALVKCLRGSRTMAIRLDKGLLQIPFLGRLWWQQEQAVFFGTLSMLMASGVRVNYGLELLGEMCPNAYLKFAYESMGMQMSQGHSLARCLQRSGLYPPMVEAMVEAGEKTGELAGMLDYAGKMCQGEAESLMDTFNTMAEPVIILVLGLVVGFIVMSTILPILDLMTVF